MSTGESIPPVAHKRFKAPVACERELLQDLADNFPPKTNYERLAIVYTQMLMALDAQDAVEICMTYADWKRRWLPWLSESQIERAFSDLEGSGYVDKRTAQSGCFYSIQTFTYPKVKAFPVSANLVPGECEPGSRSVRTTPSIRDIKKTSSPKVKNPARKEELKPTASTLVSLISDFCKEQDHPKPKTCDVETTIEVLDKLDRLDHFPPAKVEAAIRFALVDDFWRKLILSPAAWRQISPRNGQQKIVNAYIASQDPQRAPTGNGQSLPLDPSDPWHPDNLDYRGQPLPNFTQQRLARERLEREKQ